MTVQAGIAFKALPAGDRTSVFGRRFLLGSHPAGKILRSVYKNAEQHLGVLRSAILCALAKKDSRALRVYPHSVGMVRNEVRFSCELRHPKAVVGIGREQLQERWRRMIRIAPRNVQFFGRDDPQLRVSKLPPVLMSNRDHIQSARRLRSILD